MVKLINELSVVFASNDGIKLSLEHFGDAENYYFYKIFENGLVEFAYSIENKVKNNNKNTEHNIK
jgi:predicted Fe-Mo cluster-binding NifX family protein